MQCGLALATSLNAQSCAAIGDMTMQRIQEGYRAFTGYVFTAEQASAYNAAVERAERSPSEASRNGAHNLFYSIAMTGKA